MGFKLKKSSFIKKYSEQNYFNENNNEKQNENYTNQFNKYLSELSPQFKYLKEVWHPGFMWYGFDGSRQFAYLTGDCRAFFLDQEKIPHTINVTTNKKNYCFKGQDIDSRVLIDKGAVDWNDPYQVNKALIVIENFLNFKEKKKINRYESLVDSIFCDIKEKNIKLTKEEKLEIMLKYNPLSSSTIKEKDYDYQQINHFLQLIKEELIYNKNDVILSDEKFSIVSNILKLT